VVSMDRHGTRWEEPHSTGGGLVTIAMSELLDRGQIEFLLILDEGEGAALAEIVDEFLALGAKGRADLLLALGDGDLSTVCRVACSLKMASANVGAGTLSVVCTELQAAARDARAEDVAPLVRRFESEYAQVREALRELVANTA
jgi:HPt (histidine-containing phosphotransfer) domain-containing protein